MSARLDADIARAFDAAASACGLAPDEIAVRSRDRDHVHAKRIVVVILRRELGFKLDAAGAYLGHRDHTTARQFIDTHDALMDRDPIFARRTAAALDTWRQAAAA